LILIFKEAYNKLLLETMCTTRKVYRIIFRFATGSRLPILTYQLASYAPVIHSC